MQSVSARIWTRVAVSISYDDNHYTTGTSKMKYRYWIQSFDVLLDSEREDWSIIETDLRNIALSSDVSSISLI